MIFRSLDGTIYMGEAVVDVVTQMRDRSITPDKKLGVYKNAVAARVRALYGITIDSATADTFLADLKEAGLLERVDD